MSSVTGAGGVDAAPTTGDVIVSLANAGVNTIKIANTAVTGPKIANAAVTGPKIADEAVTQAKLAPGAVGTTELQESVSFGVPNTEDGEVHIFSNATAGSVVQVGVNAAGGGLMNVLDGSEDLIVQLNEIGSGGGSITVLDTDGILMVAAQGQSDGGFMGVRNAGSAPNELNAGMDGKDGSVFGVTKNFIVADPQRADRMIPVHLHRRSGGRHLRARQGSARERPGDDRFSGALRRPGDSGVH